MKKRYCFVIEINPEQMDDYVAIHKNPWKDTLELLKQAGAEDLLIYRYGNFSILFWVAEDLNEVYREMGRDGNLQEMEPAPCQGVQSVTQHRRLRGRRDARKDI